MAQPLTPGQAARIGHHGGDGDTGPAGPAGPAGASGAPGADGADGPPGPPGTGGSGGTTGIGSFPVASAVTLPWLTPLSFVPASAEVFVASAASAGQAGYVRVTPSAGSAVVTVGFPLAGLGPIGPSGATGPAGASGAPGASGAIGLTGPAGTSGATGARGAGLGINAADYGAKGDGQTVMDGSIASGSTALHSPTAAFTTADVGKTVYVVGAAAAGAVLNTTISAYVSATQVTTTDAASTTVSGAEVVWGTNNQTPLANAITAAGTSGTIYVPRHTGSFYLVDAGVGWYALRPLDRQRFVGDGRDATTIRLGPEGSSQAPLVLFAPSLSGSTTVEFEAICLQGPDIIHANANVGVYHGGTAGTLRFTNCRVRRFSFGAEVLPDTTTTVGVEAFATHFEGYGTVNASMGIGAFGENVHSAGMNIRCVGCRFSSFGDPAGGQLSHAIYAYTSWNVSMVACHFDTPAATSTGFCVQHYDSSVALADAAPESLIQGCYFAANLSTTRSIVTSYNTETKILGNTFGNSGQDTIEVAGKVLIDGNTFVTPSTQPAIQTVAPGQSSGLPWGGTISNNKFRGVVNSGTGVIYCNGWPAQWKISGNEFSGATGSNGFYVMCYHTPSGLCEVVVEHNRFDGTPNACVCGEDAYGVTVKDNTFANSNVCIRNDTTSLAALYVKGNNFSNASSADTFRLYVTPTILVVEDNFGPGVDLTLEQSEVGASGAPGPAGPSGAIGLTGPQGIPGTSGARGASGAIGLTGPMGASGATGARGISGSAIAPQWIVASAMPGVSISPSTQYTRGSAAIFVASGVSALEKPSFQMAASGASAVVTVKFPPDVGNLRSGMDQRRWIRQTDGSMLARDQVTDDGSNVTGQNYAFGPGGRNVYQQLIASNAAAVLAYLQILSPNTGAQRLDVVANAVSRMLLDSSGNSDFLQLVATGALKGIAFGTATITWPGGNKQSSSTSITHSIGRSPSIVIVTCSQLSDGSGQQAHGSYDAAGNTTSVASIQAFAANAAPAAKTTCSAS